MLVDVPCTAHIILASGMLLKHASHTTAQCIECVLLTTWRESAEHIAMRTVTVRILGTSSAAAVRGSSASALKKRRAIGVES